MSQPANASSETRAFSGIVGGLLLGVAGGALTSFIDDALLVLQAPTPLAWLRFGVRGVLILMTGTPGIFMVAAAWPTPTSDTRPIKIAFLLTVLVLSFVGGAWWAVR